MYSYSPLQFQSHLVHFVHSSHSHNRFQNVKRSEQRIHQIIIQGFICSRPLPPAAALSPLPRGLFQTLCAAESAGGDVRWTNDIIIHGKN